MSLTVAIKVSSTVFPFYVALTTISLDPILLAKKDKVKEELVIEVLTVAELLLLVILYIIWLLSLSISLNTALKSIILLDEFSSTDKSEIGITITGDSSPSKVVKFQVVLFEIPVNVLLKLSLKAPASIWT